MSLYVVAYDVSCQKRRRRLAKAILKFGSRVQESVFEVWLVPKTLDTFKVTVGSLLAKEDSFSIYPIDERGSRRRIRWQEPPTGFAPVVVFHPPVEIDWPPPGSRELTRKDWETPDHLLEKLGAVRGGW